MFGTSSVLGPVIGGLLSGAPTILGIDGWRWIFLVNVPIGAVALVVVAKVLNVPHISRGRPRIDWPGAVLLAVGLVPLLIVAEQGRAWGWGSATAVTCYVVGAVGLLLFGLVERWYGDDALLPLRLFRNSVFSLVTLVGVIVGMAMFGGIAVLPQFLQIVRGASPIESGFLMLPLVAGIMTASVTSGQLTARTGRYKVFPVVGTLLMTGALVILYFRINVDIPFWELDLYMADVRSRPRRLHADPRARGAERLARRGTWAWSPRRRRSSGSSAARSAPRCSSRSCSPRCPTRSPGR